MTDSNYDVKAAYKVVKIMFLALLLGPLFFLVAALVITSNPAAEAFDVSDPLNMALLIVTLLSVLAGNFVSRKIFEGVNQDSDTKARMETFQRGFIIRIASYEGIALFSIVVFIMTSSLVTLLFTAIALLGIIRSYPTRALIKRMVGVSEADLL